MLSHIPFLQILTIFLANSIIFAAENTKQSSTPSAPKQQPAKRVQAVMEIQVENAKFGVFSQEATQPAASDLHSLTVGQKLAVKQPVDMQKKMQMTFLVKEKSGSGGGQHITVHQAFVLLVHEETKREILYVAEPDKQTKLYTFDLNMRTAGKDFSAVGGLYSAHLLLGDSTVRNPTKWHFADLELSLPVDSAAAASQSSQLPKSARINYGALPEIAHQFRTSDPRPPAIVSDTFAAICAAPLLLLFILWFRVGLNFGNIKLSIWALGFHAGLCAIFGLYACYWLKLDMFETLKWLTLLGAPTLFCGNRLLHSFTTGGSAKKQKPE